jgi:uncharacterized tellurite resistance protein B-like protein
MAAARIVGVAALADGHLGRQEIDALERLIAHEQLGLSRLDLHDVVQALAEDLMATVSAQWQICAQMDTVILPALLDELDEPALCRRVLDMCIEVAAADHCVTDAEQDVIAAASRKWKLEAMDTPYSG